MWNRGAADGRYELRAHLDNASVFCFSADHEAGDIVKEDYGRVPAELACQFSHRRQHIWAYCWLHMRINWAAFAASFGLMTESLLAIIPTW